MIKKIFKASGSLLLSIFIATSALFTGITPINASQMSLEDNESNPMGIVIEKSVENSDVSKNNTAPDLGDDQAFPFIPGFGKNSGKD